MKMLRLVPCIALLLLAACNRQPPETVPAADAAGADATTADAATGTAATPAPATAPPAAVPTQVIEPVAIDSKALRVGSAAGPNGAATAPKRVYTLGDTVHASVATAGKSGASARVYWSYQDGKTKKEEEKTISGNVVAFTFSQADGMQPGDYMVSIDIDDVPVGMADFTVQ